MGRIGATSAPTVTELPRHCREAGGALREPNERTLDTIGDRLCRGIFGANFLRVALFRESIELYVRF